MVSVDSITAPPRVAPRVPPRVPVVGSRRSTATARARVSIDRRLWDLEEVAEILNRVLIDGRRPRYSVETIRGWVAREELPVIVLPAAWAADRGRPGWRTYRVPDVWVDRWFAMRDREPGAHVLTARRDIGGPADPPWIGVNDAGLAVGVSHETMGRMADLGLVESHCDPSGTRMIRTKTLDDWVYRMISLAEEEWYARAAVATGQAVTP